MMFGVSQKQAEMLQINDETAEMAKTAKSYDQKHFSSRCGSLETYSCYILVLIHIEKVWVCRKGP